MPILIELHYGLSAVVLALGWIVALFLGFAAGPRAGLLILVLGPVVAMWMLSVIRIACEGLLAQVQTAQNTAKLLELTAGAAVQAPADVPGDPAGRRQSSRDQRSQPALAPTIRRR